MLPKKNTKQKHGNGATLSIENEFVEAADKLLGNLDSAAYESVTLGLIFLKNDKESHTLVSRMDTLPPNLRKGKVGVKGMSKTKGHQTWK